jgi:hypothetical protein
MLRERAVRPRNRDTSLPLVTSSVGMIPPVGRFQWFLADNQGSL